MAITIRTEFADDGIGRAIIVTCVDCGHDYRRSTVMKWSEPSIGIWYCPSCEDFD